MIRYERCMERAGCRSRKSRDSVGRQRFCNIDFGRGPRGALQMCSRVNGRKQAAGRDMRCYAGWWGVSRTAGSSGRNLEAWANRSTANIEREAVMVLWTFFKEQAIVYWYTMMWLVHHASVHENNQISSTM